MHLLLPAALCVHALTTPLQVTWTGSPKAEAGRQVYRAAQVGESKVVLGSVVLLEADEADRPQQEEAAAAAAAAAGGAVRPKQQHEQYVLCLVQCMWEDEEGEKMAQVGG